MTVQQKKHCKDKFWVMLFCDPCEASDDAITGKARICTSDMFHSWINFEQAFTHESRKNSNDFFPYEWVSTVLGVVQYAHKKTIQSFVAAYL